MLTASPSISLVALAIAVCLHPVPSVAAEVTPRHQAHSHNDYLHPRPLMDALEYGFGSVEADVFLVDGELLVGHTTFELKPERTLRALYLDPLRERLKENGGFVYADQKPIILLIDIKSDGGPAFEALNQLLAEYREVFTWTQDGTSHPGAVIAIVSGNRPIEMIEAANPRFAGIDGRLSDLDSKLPADLMPLLSDNWTHYFSWRGKGEISPTERVKLKGIVDHAHAEGRLIRFWATPDNPVMWGVLRDAGVDQINTDNIKELSHFLGE